jgi:transcriptional regulator with XRE-family HTH domain
VILRLSVPHPLGQASSAGAYLRDIRQRLRLGLRDVQQASSTIAAEEKNEEFYLSAARLAQIESGDSAPSMYKLFTISVVYGVDFITLLEQFGVYPDRVHYYRNLLKLEVTHPVSGELHSFDTKVTLPVRLDPAFRWEATQLVSRLVALWGEIPAAFLQHLNPRRNMFGYIGLGDYTMYPLLRPGALVMIDGTRRRILRGGWEHEFERPIYFVELRDGYRCAWCQSDGTRLTLIPHPMSPVPAETFSLSNEAEVVGQVAGVAMRLLPAQRPAPAGVAKLPAPA